MPSLLLQLDDLRVRARFWLIESYLRRRDVRHLSPQLQTARERNLNALRGYWQRGVFPRNKHSAQWTPCFIDSDGRECAVSHLLIESGQADTAQQIAAEANYARVRELVTLSGIADKFKIWTAQSGFSRDELALIQPTYCGEREICAKMPEVWNWAISVWIPWMAVYGLTFLGVVTAAVNAIHIRRQRTGRIVLIIAVLVGVALLNLGLLLYQQSLIGRELLEPFAFMDSIMADYQISMGRGTLAIIESAINIATIGALVTFGGAYWRLRANRLLSR